MAKSCKRLTELRSKINPETFYGLEDGIKLMLESVSSVAKFDETIEIAVLLNVDPRQADQQVRSTVGLPHGTGKTKRVVVLTSTEAGKEAEAAGADFVGSDELVAKIKGGWLDFDAVIATPEMMRQVGPLGRVLGPRGMMPSAKAGTVTTNVAETVKEIKAGRVEYRIDKFGILHNAIGKVSFGNEKVLDNVKTYFGAVLRSRPAAVKGTYVKSLSLTTTQGVGVHIDVDDAEKICGLVR